MIRFHGVTRFLRQEGVAVVTFQLFQLEVHSRKMNIEKAAMGPLRASNVFSHLRVESIRS